ncbi:GroES-like protein [Trametes punicea]|nr:GroES-like protein [Trametes punicea]
MPEQQQIALLLESARGELTLKQTDVPKPGPEELLVRIEAAALNPADWKIHTFGIIVEKYPTILGFDAAGVVVEVGSAAKGYVPGDRVILQGWLDREDQSMHGVFQQYVSVGLDVITKIPDDLSFEVAATLPSCLATAAFPLYNLAEGAPSVRLLPPWEEKGKEKYVGQPIFILGGATSVGQYVIQLARLSGLGPIIVTASLHNEELLKSLGATHVLDRNLPPETLSKSACDIAGGQFRIVYDAVSVPATLEAGYRATDPTGDFIVVLPESIPGAEQPPLKRVHMAQGLFKIPINHAVGQSLLAKLPKLLKSGQIKPNRAEVIPGGLRGVPIGLERLRKNEVSASKLVVKPQETNL